jgi:hypothetical protein
MADNIENQYNQKNPRPAASSSTGWILGAVIALAAIAAIWYYGTRDDAGTVNNNVNVEQPSTTTPATPPADTSTTTTTTPPADTTTTAPVTPPADTTTTAPATPPADTTTTTPATPAPEPVTPPATNQ